MNQHVPQPRPRAPTQAAEGLPRWRWTTTELLRLKELGAFTHEDRFELIGGEIVPMSPRGRRHEVLAEQLQDYWTEVAPPDIRIGNERQFNLVEDTYTNPDLIVRPASLKTYDLSPAAALLVVEVADSSLYYDRSTKAALYALHGVREYWVVNAQTLVVTVHTVPSAQGYRLIRDIAPTEMVVPHLAPSLAVRLSDLDVA